MIQFAPTATRKSQSFWRLVHLSDLLFAHGEVSRDEVVQLFREHVSADYHQRTIHRDLELLVDGGWLEPVSRDRFRVVHENFPYQRS